MKWDRDNTTNLMETAERLVSHTAFADIWERHLEGCFGWVTRRGKSHSPNLLPYEGDLTASQPLPLC